LEIYLDPDVDFNSFVVPLIGGRWGQGGSRGAIGDGNISSVGGGSGIVDIGTFG